MINRKRCFSHVSIGRCLILALVLCLFLLLTNTKTVFARPPQMHLIEGILPPLWALFWYVLSIPAWLAGFYQVRSLINEKPQVRMLLGFSGAFVFVLSALKLPSFTGFSSHPTGTALGTVLFGPKVMVLLGTFVLVFQALLLGHGGLTTLGANTFSMAICGPLAAWAAWRVCSHMLPQGVCVFLAAFTANIVTYAVTSLQLALAFPDPTGNVWASFIKFSGLFVLTQLPLAVGEGIFTMLTCKMLKSTAANELETLDVLEPTV